MSGLNGHKAKLISSRVHFLHFISLKKVEERGGLIPPEGGGDRKSEGNNTER